MSRSPARQRSRLWLARAAGVAGVSLRAARRAILALICVSFPGAVAASGLLPQGAVFVYDCDNLATIAGRLYGDRLEVWGTGLAPFVLSKTGEDPATYADPTVTVTMNAEYLRMTGPMGKAMCRSNPAEAPWQEAKLRGVEFRATGDQPDWVLEYDEGIALTFVAGPDMPPVTAIPRRVVANNNDRMTIEASDGARDVVVAVERAVCNGPSGVTTAKVSVTIEHHTFSGCGRVLLTGTFRGTISWRGRPADGGVVSLRIVRVGAGNNQAVLAERKAPVTPNRDSPFQLEYNPSIVFGDDRFALEASIHAGSHRRCSRGRLFVLTWGWFAGVTLSSDMLTGRTDSGCGVRD